MTSAEFQAAVYEVVGEMRRIAPRDTANLALNAIKIEFVDADTARIIVDQTVAPYMPYTNEPWISPKWHGKKNPNEGWFDKFVKRAAEIISEHFQGDVTEK